MSLVDEPRFTQLKISGRLPTPRGVALEVISLTQQADASNTDIIRLISTDPALCGRVIKAANALMGSTSRPITGIADAVMVLGARALRQLVLGIALILDYRNGPCKQFNYANFWMHSLLTGIAARHLAQWSRLAAADEIFVVGLLSKIGSLALATVHAEEYGALLEQSKGKPTSLLHSLESEKFGFDERELNEAILADLHFPKIFQSLVRDYEEPENSREIEGSRSWRMLYLLQIASLMADVCMEPAALRGKLVAKLKRQAALVAIEEENLIEVGDACVADWMVWSSLLGMGRVDVPPFAELLRHSEVDEKSINSQQESLATPDTYAMRVLVVEDDYSMMSMLQTILKSAGHTVYAAKNGVAALAMVAQHHPQLIISDWMMPQMDGVTFCRKLRERDDWRDIYMIIMTAQEDSDRLVEAFEAGADDYLVKPVIPKIFLARLRAGSRVVQLQEKLALDKEKLLRLSTDLAAANEHLQLLALTDVLTSLPNRRAAMERLEQEWALAQRGNRELSCLMVDIDHFKSINDKFGHPVGDITLKSVAQTLRQSARVQDIVCRIGGEEFLVICPDTDPDATFQCAERLRKNIETMTVRNIGSPFSVSISIGAAIKTDAMKSVDDLLVHADKNLYTAKQAGRNRTIYQR